MSCACWYVDEKGKLQKRECTDAERTYQDSHKNPLCGLTDGKLPRSEVIDELVRKNRHAFERRREEEDIERELQGEEAADDSRFLRELNHGRDQES